jgi:hypothetical protein
VTDGAPARAVGALVEPAPRLVNDWLKNAGPPA